MKFFFLITITFCCNLVTGQTLSKMPDSVRKIVDEYNGVGQTVKATVPPVVLSDDAIKEKLVKIALNKNPEITAADAQVKVAEIARKKANSSMLNSVNIGANANEFVINNSPQANFFPKYNLGLSVPLDLFAKNKAEKQTANQMITVNKAQREPVEKTIRARVLILYENYKETKEILQLQKMSMEDDIAAYEKAQQDYADNIITLEDVNRVYKASVNEKSILASKQKDHNIAVIQLEEAIGMPLAKAIN